MYYSMLDWHWREPCVYHSSWNMYLSNGRACKQLCDSSVTMGWGGGFCGSHSRTIPYSCWLSCWLSYIKAVVCSVDNKFTSGCVSVSRITFFPLQFHTAHWKISMLTLFSWFFFLSFFFLFLMHKLPGHLIDCWKWKSAHITANHKENDQIC